MRLFLMFIIHTNIHTNRSTYIQKLKLYRKNEINMIKTWIYWIQSQYSSNFNILSTLDPSWVCYTYGLEVSII